ncbi:programmed cell death 1 ligand 1-like isoform X2 [Scleropages formosus]|uniref:Ig-like domain-containing protein n=1 Tax=Scleropages formosus TaxID=113540 RepID=A0A8C9V9R4_SCLFO|nr:programmed cell death 1 ligand 1 isoform X2 [Scleropages formosus]
MAHHLLLLQVGFFLPSVQALFTVEVASPSYTAEFSGDVAMECKFGPMDSKSSLSVRWQRILPKPLLRVYNLENGQEDLSFQDSQYRGRVQLMKDKLSSGRAILNISNVKINDSGTYECLVEMVGADFKRTTLTVKASYKSVKKTVRRTGNDEVELSCGSEGYPLAAFVWSDQSGRRFDELNASSTVTSDKLFHITSSVIVDTSTNNYTCTILEENHWGPSAAFSIPAEIPGTKSGKPPVRVAWLTLIVVAAMVVAFLFYHRRKGLPQGRNDDVQVGIEDEVEVEGLRKVLMSRYEVLSTNTEVSNLRAFCENELPRRLRNREGLTVGAADLLPGVRETVLLEEENGNDKTAVARSLASAWAGNSQWDPFGVRQLPLLVLVACEGAVDDLFREAALQVDQKSQFTAGDLQKLLTETIDSLLVLDGYREGSRELDESLTTFLSSRKMCRVLITARSGQCDSLRGSCRTMLKLCSASTGNEGLS